MSERLQAVVDRLDIQPRDRVLEIGCGHGVAATFVCERLDGGHLTAVDRSPKMIEAARRRNAAYVEAGTAEFLVANLEDTDLGDRRFDKIFAMLVDGELVLKLPADRCEALVEEGGAHAFQIGKRRMREWVSVADGGPHDWPALTREALAFVRA